MRLIRHLSPNGPAFAALHSSGGARAVEGGPYGPFRVLDEVVMVGKRLTPVVPTNIIGIALNYRKHAEETGKPVPERPIWFMKPTSATQDPDDAILLPKAAASHKVDYEGELAVVLGRSCRNVSRAEALSYVLGYTIANDVSARDWQFEWGGGQFCQGKSFDTFCPLGPVLVTPDEISDPNHLTLRTWVSGTLVQDSNTSDMVFDVPALIEFLSQSRTLSAGTVILTGTPSGVGAGQKPPRWLKEGDSVKIEISGIGTLTNAVSSER